MLSFFSYGQDYNDVLMIDGTSGWRNWVQNYGKCTGNKYFKTIKYAKKTFSNTLDVYHIKTAECPGAAPFVINDDTAVRAYGMLNAWQYMTGTRETSRWRESRFGQIAVANNVDEIVHNNNCDGSAKKGAYYLMSGKIRTPSEFCFLVDNRMAVNDANAGQSWSQWHVDGVTNHGFAPCHNGRGNIAYMAGNVASRSTAEAYAGAMRIKGGLSIDGYVVTYP